jgi:hypothetical protein
MPARARVPSAGSERARLVVAAPVAALWAAVVSAAPIFALVMAGSAGSGSTPSGVARIAGAGWLLGHGVALQAPADRITLVPLAVSAFAAWRLARAGVHASRASGAYRSRTAGRALAAAVAVAAAYGLLGTAVAALTSTPELSVQPPRAGLMLGGFALVAAGFGAVRHSGAGRRWARRVPAVVSGAARAGVLSAALTVAAGAAAAGVALALRGGQAAEMLGSYQTGILGQAGITTVCLVYAPNVAIWAAAYLLGPGFAVGAGTVVSPTEVLLGPLPAVPVLAGLPPAPVSQLGPALALLPLAGALVAGWWLARRSGPRAARAAGSLRPTWPYVVGAAMGSGPVAGACLGLLCLASAGSVGSGHLTSIGPSPSGVTLSATVVTAFGVMVGALAARMFRR